MVWVTPVVAPSFVVLFYCEQDDHGASPPAGPPAPRSAGRRAHGARDPRREVKHTAETPQRSARHASRGYDLVTGYVRTYGNGYGVL